jgi:D-glycero-D-manno-heptose 1,7-bisphosphate phosphatase
LNKALFLDRDGVININHGYVYKIENVEFVEGIFELVKRANQQGFIVIIVTNQSGIGRGYFTEADFTELTAWMLAMFTKQGAVIDDVLFCPHHPQAKVIKYRIPCDCRKPRPGMLKSAAQKHGISLVDSIMLGDQVSDARAAIDGALQRFFWFAPSFNKEQAVNQAKAELRQAHAQDQDQDKMTVEQDGQYIYSSYLDNNRLEQSKTSLSFISNLREAISCNVLPNRRIP